MKQLFKKLAWYPPAETKIPLHAILGAFFDSAGNFKKILCNYLQVKHCVLGNSGRTLLYLLLETLKRKDEERRDEVLIPGYTCYSVAASVAKAGLKIKVYDMNPLTFGPDMDSMRSAVSSKTLSIISQHLFGIPTSIYELKKTAKSADAYLIEDAAQALGGKLKGWPLGTTGDFGFFSFGRGKPLPLGGGGGLIGKDEDVLRELQLNPETIGYSRIAATAAAQVLSMPQIYWITEMLPLGLGETIFDPDFDVATMPFVMQKLAEKLMEILDNLNTDRRHIANIYNEAFDEEYVIPIPDESKPVHTRFPLMAGFSQIPKELKRLGVRRMYPKAIADEETIKPYLADDPVPTLGAAQIAQNLITLPTHKSITKSLAKEIAQKVMTAYQIT